MAGATTEDEYPLSRYSFNSLYFWYANMSNISVLNCLYSVIPCFLISPVVDCFYQFFLGNSSHNVVYMSISSEGIPFF